ncbi:P-loop containing nucleoside triphosphate hydrolase protein [Aspergillus tetrazonus]
MPIPPNATDQDLAQFISQLDQQVPPLQARPTMIVFCMSKQQINDYHTKLQGPLEGQLARFHADLAEPKKMAELQRFRTGRARILLATSVIGAGFDFADVDVVIHWQGAWSFCDFMQESGRTGRQPGRPGRSFCLVRPSDCQPSARDPPDRQEFCKYLNEKVCRRLPISRNFNHTLQACEPSWSLCDLCAARARQQDQVSQAVSQSANQAAEQREFLATATRFWAEVACLWCYFQDLAYPLGPAGICHPQHV